LDSLVVALHELKSYADLLASTIQSVQLLAYKG